MTIIDNNGEAKNVTNESQLRQILKEYGYKFSKINPDTKKMKQLKRELRFELKHESQSLMKDFTALTIEKLKAEIILEEDNCLTFKKI